MITVLTYSAGAYHFALCTLLRVFVHAATRATLNVILGRKLLSIESAGQEVQGWGVITLRGQTNTKLQKFHWVMIA